jgi:hypothetical protein
VRCPFCKEDNDKVIDKPGEHNLQLKPIKENWQPVNVRAVTLTPAP